MQCHTNNIQMNGDLDNLTGETLTIIFVNYHLSSNKLRGHLKFHDLQETKSDNTGQAR